MVEYLVMVDTSKWREVIEIPADATDEEIEELCRDIAFNHIDWSYTPMSEADGEDKWV